MKAAVIVSPELPYYGASGGLKGLHLVSKVLKDLGVEAVTVGLKYPYEEVGDTVVPSTFQPDEDTVLIYPEGYHVPNGVLNDYYRSFLDGPHGPVVVYVQGWGLALPRQEHETHYWGLGPHSQVLAREAMGIPDTMPIEQILLPVDPWWTRRNVTHSARIPGSIFYSPRRNGPVLDAVARRLGNRPVFRVFGADKYEIREIMAIADIFVLASETEGQSCFLNEAMSMELACVTWPSGGLPDIITHEKTGLMVGQNDVVGLCDCVARLQKEPDLARELGTEARKWTRTHLSNEAFRESVRSAWAKISM